MKQLEMIPGTNRDLSLSQWLTPPELAQKVVEWAMPDRATLGTPDWKRAYPYRVLEPSAGNGALVRPLVAAGAEVTAIELDERYVAELKALGAHTFLGNFLALHPPSPGEGFDLVLQNPPYENGLDVAFILHALEFAPRVVGIFTDRILFGVERKKSLWSKVRPMRVAFCSQRPFKGAQTDYVVLDLMKRHPCEADNNTFSDKTRTEWW